jgi:Ca-activated chloride channel family protein
MIGDFHLLRPWWLTALAPAALLVWTIARTQDAHRVWRGVIADHLLAYLLSKQKNRSCVGPLVLLGAIWAVAIVALAGPTWQREPVPFADDTAVLVIVLKVTPSMKTEDLQPDRLARSVQKIHDLLVLRGGARSALIAYAGTAHLVMPLTRDAGIVNTFAAALDPKIMPSDGDVAADALSRGAEVIAKSGQSGSILWITDGVAPEQRNALAEFRKKSPVPIRILAPPFRGPERDALDNMSAVVGARVLAISPDDADVRDLAQAAMFAGATLGGQGDHWQDAGYWLVPLVALLSTLWFRPGWMVASASSHK